MYLRCERCGGTFDHREAHRCKLVDTVVDTCPKSVDTPKIVDTVVDTPKTRHKDYEARKLQMREAARTRRRGLGL